MTIPPTTSDIARETARPGAIAHRDQSLRELGLDIGVFRPSKVAANVRLRAEVWTRMRATMPKCGKQLTWKEIGDATGYAHSSVFEAVRVLRLEMHDARFKSGIAEAP